MKLGVGYLFTTRSILTIFHRGSSGSSKPEVAFRDISRCGAPLKFEIIRTKSRNPWFAQAPKKLKLTKRHLERIWSHTHCSEDLKNLHSATNHDHATIIKANSSLFSSSSTNQDWFIRYWPSFVVSSHTYFTIIHPHYTHANLYFIWQCLWISSHLFVLHLGTINLLHLTLIRFHLISLSCQMG